MPVRSLVACAAACVAASAAVAGTTLGGAATVGATSPPSTEPVTASSAAPPPFLYTDGVLTPADGSFTAAFTASPAYDNDGAGTDSFIASIDEDSQSVVRYPLDGLGAGVDGPPQGRAELFAAASGENPEWFANTPTRLGPYPASHFVVTLTLDDGSRAAVYGVVVVRETGVTYAFATDRGADDADAARAFVESFTVPLPSPAAAVIAGDGRWSVTFPGDLPPAVAASSDGGFAYTEYRAVTDGDVATVRVTEVPPGYEWRSEVVAGFATAPVDATMTTWGGLPAAESAFEENGTDVRALVVDGGDQVITVTYADAGAASSAAADAFFGSFAIPARPEPASSVATAASTSPG